MTTMYVYDALNYSLIAQLSKRSILKRDLGITLNSNKVKLLKAGHPVMILSGSNLTKRPLFMSFDPIQEEDIEALFVKYQLDRFHEEEEINIAV
ncbi:MULTISPECIES: hypothetical protein [unclassified Flammeovirga]|uniref:hypothetical protein n=1 Tax=unclassified Flammeovirga TaxID=2637820 RepID=UPI0012E06035|nr:MULTISPECIES: hypothetical protein [unclassified Flammeovirga]MBD0402899.1 hypothetical protein [Flammeovirga sp. EKP202]